MLDCLRSGKACVKLNHFNGHQAARAVVGIFEKSVYEPPCFGVGVGKNSCNNICGDFFKKVNRIVKKHFVKQSFKLGVVYRADKLRLNFRLEISKNLCRNILGQNAEYKQPVLGFKLLNQLSRINDINLRQKLAQSGNFSV